MLLSIIIVSFNTKKILAECLESLIGACKGLSNDWEVVIVDNASRDGSVDLIKKIKTKLHQLKVVLNPENLGFAKAVNQGINQAGGDYLLLLNSDVICPPNSITDLLSQAKNLPNLGIVGPTLMNPDGTLQPSVFHQPSIIGAVKEFWLGEKGRFLKYLPDNRETAVVEAVVGGAMLIPRRIVEKVGRLDERYFMYYEDLEFCRRVRRAGFKVYYLPGVRLVHYHGQSGKKDPRKTYDYLKTSSRIYHGWWRSSLINSVIRLGQLLKKIN